MKYLFTLFSMTALFVLAIVQPVSAQTRFWRVQMFEPRAETTNNTLRITFNVQSTFASDTFSVELFENGSSKDTQAINTDYGDSGVFEFDVPSAGTYTYFVEATNNEAGDSKSSDTYQVEVSDAPEPTVTTVVVEQPAGEPAAPAAADAEAEDGATAVAAITDDAATTSANDGNEGEDTTTGEVLGEEASRPAEEQDGLSSTVITLALLAGAGLGFAAYRRIRSGA